MNGLYCIDMQYTNREGIVSVPGYAAIYLAGVNWGHYLVNAETSFRAHYAHIAKDFCELI